MLPATIGVDGVPMPPGSQLMMQVPVSLSSTSGDYNMAAMQQAMAAQIHLQPYGLRGSVGNAAARGVQAQAHPPSVADTQQ